MDILIVEDDPVFADVMSAMIEAHGDHHIVGITGSLEGALKIVDEQKVDIAFVDIALQENMTGYTVATELKRRDIVSVFMTGLPPPFDMPELAIGCLAKPFDVKDLQAFLAISESALSGRASTTLLPPNARLYIEPLMSAIASPIRQGEDFQF